MQNFFSLILEPLREIYLRFAAFSPNLLAMFIIILAGIVIARIARWIILKIFKTVNFDSWSDRIGFTSIMRKGNLWEKPSIAVASVFFWLLIIVTFMAGFSALRIQAIDNLVSQFILYIPRVFSAIIIIIVGTLVTGFISRALLISAVNRGYPFSRLLSESVRLLLIVLFLAMALEQLQVAPGIVISAFSIIFGGIVLALAISFGVGGIEAAKKIIEQKPEPKEDKKKDMEHM
ncbi:MAG: hypothetical protein WC539_09740 [Nitrospirota bacterium]